MKKVILLTVSVLLLLFSSAYPQSDLRISDFSAKFSKKQIKIYWYLNRSDFKYSRLEVKTPGSPDYTYLMDFNVTDGKLKSINDSIRLYRYENIYMPKSNGVYYFRITVYGKSLMSPVSEELKIGISNLPDFKLFQNSPNPFNPSTSITYEIYSATRVTLKVFAMDGREIATLVDDFRNPGVYKVDFDSNIIKDLSSGIYFYKLQTDYSSDIGKMIFTK
ncbi:T9SS C-terminal target domain-containing protein [bacterium]|nr:MAG: T9SS C-terminal target domain-containing protein [bacterium]